MRPLTGIPVLVTIEAQQGYDHESYWGSRSNPRAEYNIARLQTAFRLAGQHVVHVQYETPDRESPLFRLAPGFAFKQEVAPRAGEVVLNARVHNAFIGTGLDGVLRQVGASLVVVAGFTTCLAVSTTVRMASDMGFQVVAAEDAMCQFDLPTPAGPPVPALLAHDVELCALQAESAEVMPVDLVLASLWPRYRALAEHTPRWAPRISAVRYR